MRGNGRYLAAGSALALILSGVLAGQAQAQAKASTVDELIVTAERRAQNLQTTAISATVLDQKTLEAKGVVGLTTLQYAAPGLQISTTPRPTPSTSAASARPRWTSTCPRAWSSTATASRR